MNQPFNGRTAIRGAIMVMGSTYVTYALGLLTSVLVARTLGPNEFGRYTYMVWMAGLLIMFSNNGLTTTVIRFASESLGRGSPETARSIHGWLRRWQLVCVVLVTLVFLLIMPFFTPAGWEGHLAVFAGVVLVAAIAKSMFLFDVSVAKGYGLFHVEARSTVTMSLINIVAVLVLVAMKASLLAYLLLFTAVSVGYVVCSSAMLRKAGVRPSPEPIEPATLVRLKRHLGWTVVLTLSYAISNKSIETWMLNAMVGSAAVGYFAIAAALTRGGVDLLASGLGTVLMPMMGHAFGKTGQDGVNAIMANAMRYFAFIGLLLAGTGALLADTAVALLYGAEYKQVVGPLRAMMVVGGFTMIGGAFNALLSTTDNQHLRVGYVLFSIVSVAVLSLLLIPRYGLNGAVAAHAISEVLIFALMATGVSRLLKLRVPWRELGRMLACALVALAIAIIPMLISGINLWTELAAGLLYAAVFVLGTMVMRAWRAGDVHQLGLLLQRYPALASRLQGRLQRWADGLPADGAP
ncbi:oligosaccharide flippase family protein [Pseudoxanthomonas japonensis]|uniref:oligosaccharide flippase family protein n=1 Tax=Pseudoxanthomonas japonensis TaxID=69284 RepID=UPI00286A8FAC|nr:oligosaccharide flippase family protein [Pseudoxanthomonas japonensis]